MDSFINIGLYHFIAIALMLFSLGIFGILVSKNLLKTLISLEIMFCGITLNLAAFSVYCDVSHFKGSIFALAVIILTSLHLVTGLAISLNIYKFKGTTEIDEIGELRG